MRDESELYPDLTAEAEKVVAEGFTPDLLDKIITKFTMCKLCMEKLYKRYEALKNVLPIMVREPRFKEDPNVINNKLNNDFFGEINDFKIGYFAGKPIAYSYNHSQDSTDDTGGDDAVDVTSKALSDFVALNNMPDVDEEITKFATVCGYAGRLLYTDSDGSARVMVAPPYEAILLSTINDITQPEAGVRYYKRTSVDGQQYYMAECYNGSKMTTYKGQVGSWTVVEDETDVLYDMCPLQGIPNNGELLGDAEKVTELIDAYDRAFSDQSNEVESFSNAYMCFENVNITDEEMGKAQRTGTIRYYTGTGNGNIHFLTKDAAGELSNKHLDRLENNIYRFAKTPNLNDESFGTASGVALKFRLTALETKCGIFQNKVQSAATYMFRCLSNALAKKSVVLDPLEVDLKFSRNFPLDLLSEAQSAQQMIAAGLPKRVAYSLAFPEIDDVDEVMQEIEAEKDDIPPLDSADETTNVEQVTDDGNTDNGQTAAATDTGTQNSGTP